MVEGVAAGCREAGCALLGGETAELPDMYGPDDLDLAGFALGIVERDAIIDGSAVAAGDAVIGLAASGVHANGFTLVRRLLERAGLGPGDAPGDLLAPTRIYASASAGLRAACDVRAMAHITGGGLPGNLPRVLPAGLGARVDERRWQAPAVFGWLAGLGVERGEMRRVFNGGIGFAGRRARGRGRGGDRGLPRGAAARRGRSARSCPARASSTSRSRSDVRIGVLVSGSGSNLQALIERVHGRSATIAGVCSSNHEAFALERARDAGIESAVFALAAYAGERDARDRAMADWLAERGRRPRSLRRIHGRARRRLPRRASLRACSTCTPRCCRRFPARTRSRTPMRPVCAETGVTVHLVDEVLDGGPIVAQSSLPVNYDENPEGLRARIHEVEHRLLPAVVEDVARGALDLDVIARKART